MESDQQVQILDKSSLKLPLVSSNLLRPSHSPRTDGASKTLVPPTIISNAHTRTGTSTAVPDSNTGVTPTTSYARVTAPKSTRPKDIPAHKFKALQPIRHGNQGTLVIPRDLQLFQLNKFKHALIGRLMLNKGDKPRQTRDLKEELQGLWKPSAPWHLMPMGKGYYTLKFQSQEDKAAAKEKLLWELSVGSIRLRDWVRYFDPYKESSSIAQIWVRIYYLPVELWHPEVISGIGRWLGQPLKIDGISMTEDVGSYVRMLVEVDLAQPLPETMSIDGGDYSFPVEFCYESIPLFCTRCKITGHSVDKCRRGAKSKPSDVVEKPMVKDPQWKTVNKTGGKQVQENRLSALVNVINMEGELNAMEEQHNMQQQVSEEEETVNKTGGMHVQENRFSALIDVNNMEGEHTSMEEQHGMQQQTSEEKEIDAPDK
ncbi:uncharacterized protein LOC130994533 [Salvia miltiorrhiza]|uniref:uncharacterized protein LOC130994533 n=1 Tax=Salvia miltiorrhiza TaxID=226208 RepID=UPI0025AD0862|nr:uncharacterized protein LOC130994533 [Salvia miltiorrhiza]